ncbi:MAG: hypothetical protein R6W68_03055 [Ignavibacteriaceae bacterium]
MNKKLSRLLILIVSVIIFSCAGNDEKSNPIPSGEVAINPDKDAEIQRYNLELMKKRSERFPCDTISVSEFVLKNYPAGTYLLETDKAGLYSIPNHALIYYNFNDGKKYIFALIAASRSGERLIETKNLIGYNESYIDLDSTKLGTPFIYLILLECYENNLSLVWEALIPSHGGFDNFSLNYWEYGRTPFIQTDFYYAQGIGMIQYNYFLIDGIRANPHLLMTYNGVDFKRTIANLNNDKFPDYYEYVFVSLPDRIYPVDSVAFYWRQKDSVYVNSRNSKQTRPY